MVTLHGVAGALVALGVAAGCGEDPLGQRDGGQNPLAQHVPSTQEAQHDGPRIAILDDCDAGDAAWAPTAGCLQRRGDVTFAEFIGELASPLAVSVVGHQAWRNEPSYVKTKPRTVVGVQNEGGRVHTFTRVAAFGGGRVPPLNQGLEVAPECAEAIDIPPGGSIQLSGLDLGDHHFQCCIHPWMRTLVTVQQD